MIGLGNSLGSLWAEVKRENFQSLRFTLIIKESKAFQPRHLLWKNRSWPLAN